MDHPLVSITVCVRNGDHWIDGCLEALVAQTYPNVEILLVDDGSTDGGSERAKQWHDPQGERGPPVRIHHQAALGLSAGRRWAALQCIAERCQFKKIFLLHLHLPSICFCGMSC